MTPDFLTVDAGRPWAALIGYSRAVRVDRIIEVAGTSATLPDGTVVAPGDVYGQTHHILGDILAAVRKLGGDVQHIVRTRVFLVDIDRWPEAGRAHGEVFAATRPASTFVEVRRLLLPQLVVEVEATAILPTGAPQTGNLHG
jgi:enamine deaminase RidA (YjgF/YER057c/UK114 family)